MTALKDTNNFWHKKRNYAFFAMPIINVIQNKRLAFVSLLHCPELFNHKKRKTLAQVA